MKASTMSSYACPPCPCATHLSNHERATAAPAVSAFDPRNKCSAWRDHRRVFVDMTDASSSHGFGNEGAIHALARGVDRGAETGVRAPGDAARRKSSRVVPAVRHPCRYRLQVAVALGRRRSRALRSLAPTAGEPQSLRGDNRGSGARGSGRTPGLGRAQDRALPATRRHQAAGGFDRARHPCAAWAYRGAGRRAQGLPALREGCPQPAVADGFQGLDRARQWYALPSADGGG